MKTVGAIAVILNLNTAQFSKGFVTAGRDLNRFAAQAKLIGTRVRSLGRAFTTHLTLPILGLGAVITKFGYDFSKGLEFANTMMKLSAGEMADFRKGVLELSDEYGKSSADIAKSAYQVSSVLHTTGQDTLKILEATAAGAKAGKITTIEATNAVVRIMSIFGIQAKDTMDTVDLLSATVEAGNATWQDMASVLPQVAGIAKPLGVSLRELGGAFALVSGRAGSTHEAGTALRGLLLAFIKPSEEMEAALTDIGMALGFKQRMTAQDLIQTVGLEKLIGELAKRYGTNAEAIGKLIPRIRGILGATALFSNEGRDLAAVMDRVSGSVGETRRQIEAGRGPAERFTESMTRMKNALIRMFDVILPSFEKLTTGINKLAKWLSGLTEAQRKSIVKWAAILAVIGPVLSAIGMMMIGISGLITFFTTLLPAIVALIAPIVATGLAITAVAAAFVNAYGEGETFKDRMFDIWEATKAKMLDWKNTFILAFKLIWIEAKYTAKQFWNVFEVAFDNFFTALFELKENSKALFAWWAENWKKIITGQWGELTGPKFDLFDVSKYKDVISEAMEIDAAKQAEIADAIAKSLGTGVTEGVQKAAEAVAGIQERGRQAAQDIQNVIRGIQVKPLTAYAGAAIRGTAEAYSAEARRGTPQQKSIISNTSKTAKNTERTADAIERVAAKLEREDDEGAEVVEIP